MTTPTSKPLNITVNDDGHIVIKFTDSTIEGKESKKDFIIDVKREDGKITQEDALLLLGVLEQALKNQEEEMKSGKSEGNNALSKGVMSSIGEAVGEVVQGLERAIGADVQSGQEVKTIDWGNIERSRNEAFNKFFNEGNFEEAINKIFKVQEAEKSEENTASFSAIKDAMSSIGEELSSLTVGFGESVQGLVSVISGGVQSGQEVKPIDRGTTELDGFMEPIFGEVITKIRDGINNIIAPSSAPSKASAAVADVREVPPSSRV
tara:strand:+ start:2776 stop:3567 length:792 start_codon:yes stop_codon:yes gene_type:complete